MNKYKQLWASVIHRAVIDLKKKNHKDKALAWIKSKEKAEQSFIWCCGVLDIDPDKTRSKILKNCGA